MGTNRRLPVVRLPALALVNNLQGCVTSAKTGFLSIPALGRRRHLCIGLLLKQAPVFLVNSRPDLDIAARTCPGSYQARSMPLDSSLKRLISPMYHIAVACFAIDRASRAPLLPKLRGQFAEFLNEGSPERLRILSSPTCVGLRYGHRGILVWGFSWRFGLPGCTSKRAPSWRTRVPP